MMNDMTRRMAAELGRLDVGPVVTSTSVLDVPYVLLADGSELCSDGQGAFDVWRDGDPVIFDLTPEQARTLGLATS